MTKEISKWIAIISISALAVMLILAIWNVTEMNMTIARMMQTLGVIHVVALITFAISRDSKSS